MKKAKQENSVQEMARHYRDQRQIVWALATMGIMLSGLCVVVGGVGFLGGCSRSPRNTADDNTTTENSPQPSSSDQPADRNQAPARDGQAGAAGSKTVQQSQAHPALDNSTKNIGWDAHFVDSSGSVIQTVSPTAAFALASDQAVFPPVASDGFLAIYSGVLTIDKAGTYRFGAEAQGGLASLAIKVATGTAQNFDLPATGKRVFSDWLDLPAGRVLLTYTFAREGSVAARLRPLWEMQRAGDSEPGFGDEPIPARVISLVRSMPKAALIAQGRKLLGSLSCTQCHASPSGAVIARSAPDLSHVAQRVDPDWMGRWIVSPQTLKPGSGMPDVIGESEEDLADAQAMVAYLVSLSEPTDWPAPATEEQVLGAGRELYKSIGCIACHGMVESQVDGDGQAGPDEFTPVAPFGELHNKWNVAALSVFLQDPHAARPSGRMPAMGLTPEEADEIATYLASVWGAGDGQRGGEVAGLVEFEQVTDEFLARGRRALAIKGCATCHAIEGLSVDLTGKPIAAMDSTAGCLDALDTGTPRYVLTSTQRSALQAAIRNLAKWAAAGQGRQLAFAPIDHALATMQAFNCTACHQWQGKGGVAAPMREYFQTIADVDLGDEGRFPPRLSGVGWKLTSQWLGQVLDQGARARPAMKARMPVFASTDVHELVDGLAAVDGVWAERDAPEPEVNDQMVQAGRMLVGTGGLNCVACHVFGDKPPVGIPGPNIADFGERIRYDWWRRYIQAPSRFKPSTRMPDFFLRGTSPQGAVLGGDPHKQADAMWAYFSLGSLFMPAPEGVAVEGGFEVLVKDEPIVLRTFLSGVGARGIAIGFPAGVHFAFDANTARLVYAWSGSFLDASGAWAGRGGSVVTGQGPTVWTAPDGPLIQLLDSPADVPMPWADAPMPNFRGYRFDEARMPTFMSQLGSVKLDETWQPYPRDSVLFSRTLELTGLSPGQVLMLQLGERSRLVGVEGAKSSTAANGIVHAEVKAETVTMTLEVLP